MENVMRVAWRVLAVAAFFWAVLTVWVQFAGAQRTEVIGREGAPRKALILYNPDPIYNFDEQVGRAFAEGLGEKGFFVRLVTDRQADNYPAPYDLYVFCANTYNWAPDWMITRYITNHPELRGQRAVALTVGAGETDRAQRRLEECLRLHGLHSLGSRAYWLLRPNDERRMDEPNVDVARDLARAFGREIGDGLPALAR